MTLNLISLATIKAQLGITASTYDSALTAIIPIVSADVRRILNNRFSKYYAAAFDSTSKNIDLSVYTYHRYDDGKGIGEPDIGAGTVVYNSNLPADTYLDSFDPITGLFTLSAPPTGTGDHVYPSVSIAQWPTISKMVWYRYSTQSVNDANVRCVASESFGPVSVSYSDSEINKQYNYPQTLINDLGKPFASVC